jgi:hypothetical protein
MLSLSIPTLIFTILATLATLIVVATLFPLA